MEHFNRNNFLDKMNQEFKRTDEFYMNFKSEFKPSVLDKISHYYPENKISTQLITDIYLFADELISAAENTLYKDSNYAGERMAEEVKAMRMGASNISLPDINYDFSTILYNYSKKIIVDYFPGVYELSSNGFRLLDFYVQLYHIEFVTSYYRHHMTGKQV